MNWFFPSANGDFRLVAQGSTCSLVIAQATPAEWEQLGAFLAEAVKKKWATKKEVEHHRSVSTDIWLNASVIDAGKLLLKHVRPKKAVLTAVKMVGGKLTATDDTGSEVTEGALDQLLNEPEAQAAVSVSRPTPCCPDCQPGAMPMASEVLQSFLSPEEHASWAKQRQIIVVGHLSGHRYLLSHRNHPRAQKDTRICYDLDSKCELKFFDWGVPPEEEVLATKLILEHREPWLRNEATLFHMLEESRSEPIFKNPFGAHDDGTADAAFFRGFGTITKAFAPRTKRTWSDFIDEHLVVESIENLFESPKEEP